MVVSRNVEEGTQCGLFRQQDAQAGCTGAGREIGAGGVPHWLGVRGAAQ